MKLSLDEHEAIKRVIAYGAYYGYGKLITHLRTAWARKLMDKTGMGEAEAREVAGPGYPFELWDDFVRNGEWDETGEKYK